MNYLSPKSEQEIEKAIIFLVNSVEKFGHNSKPVIIHSIKVGLHLQKLGYNKDIIVAGLLHDLLEDTSIREKDIINNFGEKVS